MKMLLKLCTQRWKMAQYVTNSVCENNMYIRGNSYWQSAAGIILYRTLTDIHINTQYISTAYTHNVTTHMSCSLELASFCTATWHHSLPDSSVCGCALWRRDLSPNVLSVEGEEGDGKGYYTRGVKMNNLKEPYRPTYLEIGLTYVSFVDVTQYHFPGR